MHNWCYLILIYSSNFPLPLLSIVVTFCPLNYACLLFIIVLCWIIVATLEVDPSDELKCCNLGDPEFLEKRPYC